MNDSTPAPGDGQRTAYIAGLRALADVLEQHAEVPLPYGGSSTSMTIYFLGGKAPRTAMAATARAFPCNWRKQTREYEDGRVAYFDMDSELHGLKVQLTAYREAVCERVVTGTREVTEKVKDPDALAAVPEVEVTKTVEDVEWRCHPLMAPEAAVTA